MPVLAPCRTLTAGLLQDPLPDLDDQPGLLEQGNEVVRLDYVSARVSPADQGLHSGGAHVAQIESGLIDQEELIVEKGIAQVHLEFHTALDRVLHPGLEYEVTVLAVPLGLVHRDVRVAEELLGRGSGGRRDPDARGHRQVTLLLSCKREWFLESVLQTLGNQLRSFCERELLGDHDELVPAEAPERIGVAHSAIQSLGYRSQELIAGAA